MTTDFWLSKLFYELLQPALAKEYLHDRNAVLARYPLSPEVVEALRTDDVAALYPRVNAYLLRFYFSVCGMPEDEFVRRIRAAATVPVHG